MPLGFGPWLCGTLQLLRDEWPWLFEPSRDDWLAQMRADDDGMGGGKGSVDSAMEGVYEHCMPIESS